MAIDVMIKRRVEQGRQAKELVPLILHLRVLATYQPGYISGTTLSNLEHPDECLVVSRWESLDDWNAWRKSKQRTAIENKIEALTGEKTEVNIYAPMLADTDQGQGFKKKLGQLNNNW
ncbi:MAG: antibiotic biosynthesis monooxygenase [Desulfobacterales bacterium]|jgi:heme-degrading monooxygenase HmoA